MPGASWPSIRSSRHHFAVWPAPRKNWERLTKPSAPIASLSLLDDTDPAGVHYHLASLLRQAGKPQEARREVLKSLEEAPRFREAHQLLLELIERDGPTEHSPKRPAVP